MAQFVENAFAKNATIQLALNENATPTIHDLKPTNFKIDPQTMTELEILRYMSYSFEKIDETISNAKREREALSIEFQNQERNRLQPEPIPDLDDYIWDHVRDDYRRGKFGKLLVKFSAGGWSEIVPLSFDPQIKINPQHENQKRLALSTPDAPSISFKFNPNYRSWRNLELLFKKEKVYKKIIDKEEKKNYPKMYKLLYIMPVENPPDEVPEIILPNTPSPPPVVSTPPPGSAEGNKVKSKKKSKKAKSKRKSKRIMLDNKGGLPPAPEGHRPPTRHQLDPRIPRGDRLGHNDLEYPPWNFQGSPLRPPELTINEDAYHRNNPEIDHPPAGAGIIKKQKRTSKRKSKRPYRRRSRRSL